MQENEQIHNTSFYLYIKMWREREREGERERERRLVTKKAEESKIGKVEREKERFGEQVNDVSL